MKKKVLSIVLSGFVILQRGREEMSCNDVSFLTGTNYLILRRKMK